MFAVNFEMDVTALFQNGEGCGELGVAWNATHEHYQFGVGKVILERIPAAKLLHDFLQSLVLEHEFSLSPTRNNLCID
mgnify:CR=1 FL=1